MEQYCIPAGQDQPLDLTKRNYNTPIAHEYKHHSANEFKGINLKDLHMPVKLPPLLHSDFVNNNHYDPRQSNPFPPLPLAAGSTTVDSLKKHVLELHKFSVGHHMSGLVNEHYLLSSLPPPVPEFIRTQVLPYTYGRGISPDIGFQKKYRPRSRSRWSSSPQRFPEHHQTPIHPTAVVPAMPLWSPQESPSSVNSTISPGTPSPSSRPEPPRFVEGQSDPDSLQSLVRFDESLFLEYMKSIFPKNARPFKAYVSARLDRLTEILSPEDAKKFVEFRNYMFQRIDFDDPTETNENKKRTFQFSSENDDPIYQQKRMMNNLAAKKSRDHRKCSAKEIIIRFHFLLRVVSKLDIDILHFLKPLPTHHISSLSNNRVNLQVSAWG